MFSCKVVPLPSPRCEEFRCVFLSHLSLKVEPRGHVQRYDSCRGITELFGPAAFDLKPLSHTQNALLASASRGDVTRQHEKKLQRESELNESLALCLAVALLLSEVRRVITYEWTAAIDVVGMERGASSLHYKALSNHVNNPFNFCQEHTACSSKQLSCIQHMTLCRGFST